VVANPELRLGAARIESDPGSAEAFKKHLRSGRVHGGGRGEVAQEKPRRGDLQRIGGAGEGVHERERGPRIADTVGQRQGSPERRERCLLGRGETGLGRGLKRQRRRVGDIAEGRSSFGTEGVRRAPGRGSGRLLEERA
jgi:hypothetical protein